MKLHPTVDLILGRLIIFSVLIGFPLLFIWAIYGLFTGNHSSQISQNTQEAIWIEQSEDAVRERLKDPDSAQFKEVFFNNKGGIHAVCGQINSKNSYGGYSGYKYFISAGSKEMTFIENEVSDFSKVWNKFCLK